MDSKEILQQYIIGAMNSKSAIAELEKLEHPTPSRIALERNEHHHNKMFTHTGCCKK